MTDTHAQAPAPASRAGGAIPPAFVAVVLYTLRACLPAKRWFGVLLPCAGALLLALIVQGAHESDRIEAWSEIARHGLFGLVLPLTCLVIGDAVLGADARAGTFQLTWLSPVPFPTIAVGRWLGGWLVSLVTVVPAFALAANVAGQPESTGAIALAAAAGSAAYVALFLLLGVLVKRSTIWSLTVVLVGERLIGSELAGVGQVSPMWQAQQVFAGLWEDSQIYILRDGMPEGTAAVVRLALVGAVCLAVATWRLRGMRPISGDD
ncbi:MAG TPA: hypothetical protein VIL36_21705 [Acidimicrobiales bacterium]